MKTLYAAMLCDKNTECHDDISCMCRFITCSVITFATVIAITKDLPDVDGDRKYGIETFSTRLGTRAVTFLGEVAHSALQLLQT